MSAAEELREMRLKELRLLNQIGREFSSTLDMGSVIGRIMRRVKEVIGCDAGSVILYDEAKDSLVFYAASGAGANKLMGLSIPRGKGIAGWVFEKGTPLVVQDVAADKRFYSAIDKITGVHTKSLVCVPIRKDIRVLGVIEAINKEAGDFTRKDLEMLTAISQLAAVSIDNSTAHKNLEHKNRELVRLNREMEEFVHIVSHDLQTPLASIGGYIELIKTEMEKVTGASDTLHVYIKRIEENSRNTLQFVRRLLDYSSLKSTKVKIDEFNPLGVLKEVLMLLGNSIKQWDAEIVHQENMPVIRSDRYLFHHILLNLIQNSLKYAVRGGDDAAGPVDGIHTPPKKLVIEMGVEDKDDGFQFFVRDNGPGMSEEDREVVFQFYERGGNHSRSMSMNDGYGIGLAFVKKAVQILNGDVWIESREGEGTTFFFTIPQ
jgi:signal transduction histidine kinase